jgi:hypothetical protein
MRKVSLDLGKLDVESFETKPLDKRGGTAFGFASDNWSCGAQCVTGDSPTCDCSGYDPICTYTGAGYPMVCGETSDSTCTCETAGPTDEPLEPGDPL